MGFSAAFPISTDWGSFTRSATTIPPSIEFFSHLGDNVRVFGCDVVLLHRIGS